MNTWPKSVELAYEQALKTLKKSHAPYSGLHVAASLKLEGVDELIPGCNVENASYGATICAERTAFVQAVALHGPLSPEFIVICSDAPGDVIPPCGMCLQVMQEFVSADFPVYLSDLKGVKKKLNFKELLPCHFDGKMLPKKP